jgi:hypothetical protein
MRWRCGVSSCPGCRLRSSTNSTRMKGAPRWRIYLMGARSYLSITLCSAQNIRRGALTVLQSQTGSMVMSSIWRTTMSRFTQYREHRWGNYRRTSESWDGHFPRLLHSAVTLTPISMYRSARNNSVKGASTIIIGWNQRGGYRASATQ